MNYLTKNLDKIHTTEMGKSRIKKNLDIKIEDVDEWCKRKIKKSDLAIQRGKNWYVHTDDLIITINASSYTVITAHKKETFKR